MIFKQQNVYIKFDMFQCFCADPNSFVAHMLAKLYTIFEWLLIKKIITQN